MLRLIGILLLCFVGCDKQTSIDRAENSKKQGYEDAMIGMPPPSFAHGASNELNHRDYREGYRKGLLEKKTK